MRALDRAAPVGITMAVALVGCADVLGIQPFETEIVDSAADGPPDGSVGATDAPASARDGTVSDSEASIETDGGALDGDAGGSTCTPGGPCNAGECQSGQWGCSDAGAVCTPTGAVEAGTSCTSASSDGGTYVCSGTACVQCAAGEDCSSPDAGSCQKRTIDCSSGAPQCTAAGTLPEGESCGGTNYCYGGVCSACKNLAPCSPSGVGSNSCHAGITSCTNGVAQCAEQTTPAAAGAACKTSTGASGVCDGNSTCVACSQGGACTPGGNTCKSGAMSCSGGYACTAGSNINQGQPCGSGAICSSGACVACNATSCANGCCDSKGCVTAQSTSECGTGAGGGACRACVTPTGGTATCSANNCNDQCSTGSHLCGTTCASNTSPSTCGSACSPCTAPNVATAGCSGTACTITLCSSSFADCNGTFSDGCEASLLTSSAHCGSCSNACPSGQTCVSGTCTPPSCQTTGAGRTNCGPTSESCCASGEVAGGTFDRTYTNSGSGPSGEADPASVSGFRLDKYLVTVGRFRQFVTAWNNGSGYLPAAGSGKHTHLNGGKGLTNSASPGNFETGWVTADNASVAPTNANLSSCSTASTWTNTPGSQENLPIDCVVWPEAYAFCIWDGGFLPSETELEYAQAGGALQREYPWGSADPGMASEYAIYDCYYPTGSGSTNSCTGTVNIAPVGTAPLGAGLWGQLDLGGDSWEYTMDWFATFVDPCVDCAYLNQFNAGLGRIFKGGAFAPDSSHLLPTDRQPDDPPTRNAIGMRCARIP